MSTTAHRIAQLSQLLSTETGKSAYKREHAEAWRSWSLELEGTGEDRRQRYHQLQGNARVDALAYLSHSLGWELTAVFDYAYCQDYLTARWWTNTKNPVRIAEKLIGGGILLAGPVDKDELLQEVKGLLGA